MSKKVNVKTHRKNRIVANESDALKERTYPKNTVLVGGHPNWLKRFKQNYPNVKICQGDATLNASIITSRTPLVLVNTTHMCHAAYCKIKHRLDETGAKWQYIYPSYRWTNMNSASK